MTVPEIWRLRWRLGGFNVELHYGTDLEEEFRPSFSHNFVTAKIRSDSVTKTVPLSHSTIRHNTDPVARSTLKWPIISWCYWFCMFVCRFRLCMLFEGVTSRGYCCSRSILCWSHYLVPLPIHTLLQSSYHEDVKSQISLASTNHNNFLVTFAGIKIESMCTTLLSFMIHVHPCHPL